MKNEKVSIELKELMNDKGEMCVSIIIPVDEHPSFTKSDQVIIEYAIEKLEQLSDPKYATSLIQEVIQKIKGLQGKINLANGMNGIGIFISPTILKVVQFPFPVKEKIHVSDSFEIRDLLYYELYLKDYFLISLNMDKVHLLIGKGNVLTEVCDTHFPVVYKDDYEYSKPSRGSSYSNSLKGFEKDKSILTEIRMEAFFNTLDQKLNKYLDTDTPLVLAGVKKDMGYFEKTTRHKNNIAGKVLGSYDNYNSNELQSRAWEVMKAVLNKEEDKMISSIKELIGNEIVSTGIKNVWRDAKSGKGNILVVEKDLATPGFVTEDESKLLLRPPQVKHKIITNAVDEVIEAVIEKNGRVVFVDNEQLHDFDGIALINRY